jgi:hypothetical protein
MPGPRAVLAAPVARQPEIQALPEYRWRDVDGRRRVEERMIRDRVREIVDGRPDSMSARRRPDALMVRHGSLCSQAPREKMTPPARRRVFLDPDARITDPGPAFRPRT